MPPHTSSTAVPIEEGRVDSPSYEMSPLSAGSLIPQRQIQTTSYSNQKFFLLSTQSKQRGIHYILANAKEKMYGTTQNNFTESRMTDGEERLLQDSNEDFDICQGHERKSEQHPKAKLTLLRELKK
jgi:hypothetical protein